MYIYYGTRDIKASPSDRTANLVSVGVFKCKSSDALTLRRDGRVDWSLFYCERGTVDFGTVRIREGEAWIYPPSVMQRYVVYAREHTVYRYLHFNGRNVGELLGELNVPTESCILPRMALRDLFEKLTADAEESTPLSRLRAEYHILQIISLLAEQQEGERKHGQIKRITDNMEHTFAEPYCAQKYADMLHVSVSRFHHLFKEAVGVAPYAYYSGIRMENACGLLERSRLRIAEVARSCGFDDPLHFTQAFKKHTGMTPSDYRRIKGASE